MTERARREYAEDAETVRKVLEFIADDAGPIDISYRAFVAIAALDRLLAELEGLRANA